MPAFRLTAPFVIAAVTIVSCCHACDAFQASATLTNFMGLRVGTVSSQWSQESALRSRRGGLSLSMTAIDRRSFLAAAGALFSAIDKNSDGKLDDKEIATFAGAGGSGGSGGAAQKADEKAVKKLVEGLQNLKGDVPYADQAIAVFTDDSAISAAAVEAVKAVGAKLVEVPASASVEDAKDTYKSNECVAALIATEPRVKAVMAGAGLECQRCGFFGDAAPPKWIVVFNPSKGKPGSKIQEEAQLSGRECDAKGMCYQSGTPIPVYTADELASIKGSKLRGGIEDDNNSR